MIYCLCTGATATLQELTDAMMFPESGSCVHSSINAIATATIASGQAPVAAASAPLDFADAAPATSAEDGETTPLLITSPLSPTLNMPASASPQLPVAANSELINAPSLSSSHTPPGVATSLPLSASVQATPDTDQSVPSSAKPSSAPTAASSTSCPHGSGSAAAVAIHADPNISEQTGCASAQHSQSASADGVVPAAHVDLCTTQTTAANIVPPAASGAELPTADMSTKALHSAAAEVLPIAFIPGTETNAKQTFPAELATTQDDPDACALCDHAAAEPCTDSTVRLRDIFSAPATAQAGSLQTLCTGASDAHAPAALQTGQNVPKLTISVAKLPRRAAFNTAFNSTGCGMPPNLGEHCATRSPICIWVARLYRGYLNL